MQPQRHESMDDATLGAVPSVLACPWPWVCLDLTGGARSCTLASGGWCRAAGGSACRWIVVHLTILLEPGQGGSGCVLAPKRHGGGFMPCYLQENVEKRGAAACLPQHSRVCGGSTLWATARLTAAFEWTVTTRKGAATCPARGPGGD